MVIFFLVYFYLFFKIFSETGLSPESRMNVSLPNRSTISPLARFTGSGDSPTSTRSRKRGPRAGDELFGIERRFLRKSRDVEEREGVANND